MKKLLRYMKDYKKESILAPLFKLFEAVLELIVPILLAMIIDNGINGNLGLGYVLKMTILMIVLGLVGLVCSITAQYFSAKAATGFSKILREKLFSKMQSLSYNEIDKLGTASMVTQITSDVNQVQNGVNLFLRLFLRSPFVVAGALIMALIVNPKASIIFLIVISVLMILVFFILFAIKKQYKDVQNNLDVVTRKTRDNLVGVRVIRAFTKESEEKESFNSTVSLLSFKQKKAGLISSLLNPLTYVIINIGIIFVIYIAGKEVESQNLLQGDVLALYNYMSQILVELIKFANLVITISKALASASRISKTLDLQSSLEININNEIVNTNDKILEFNNVYFSYSGQSGYALDNINFSLNKGEKLGIIGGTGSGKTSLVNLIGHFYDCTKGTVYYKGKDIKTYPLDIVRNEVSFALQKATLFKGTIKSNLLWRKKEASDYEIYDVLEIAQCNDFVLNRINGIDSVVEQGGKNFSGGQRQRLCIARALIGDPQILVLDDSSSALDYQTDLKLRTAINQMKNPPTTIIVSQRTSSIMNCDKIIVLDNGKVVGLGSHKELLNNCDIYKEIYNSQFKGGDDYND